MRQFIWGAVFGASCTMANGAGSVAAVSPEMGKALERLTVALEQTQKHYIQEPSLSDLVDNAIDGMLSKLDPHSKYMSAKTFPCGYPCSQRRLPDWVLRLTQELGMTRIVAPVDGGPAAASGIRPGDAILAVDDQSTLNMSLDQVINLLRGPEKSRVTITIRMLRGKRPRLSHLRAPFSRRIKSGPSAKAISRISGSADWAKIPRTNFRRPYAASRRK